MYCNIAFTYYAKVALSNYHLFYSVLCVIQNGFTLYYMRLYDILHCFNFGFNESYFFNC